MLYLVKNDDLQRGAIGMIADKDEKQLEFMSFDDFITKNEPLSLFQKILLATDGTVTDLLRLYTGESITVEKLEQQFTFSGEKEKSLCSNNTKILKRSVLLKSNRQNYVYAESIYMYELLSPWSQDKLLNTDMPIGLLWKKEKLDTYREIIGYWTEPCNSLAQYFGTQEQSLLLSRAYLVMHSQNIIGRIIEKFPITYFQSR